MKIAYLHGLESNIDQKDPKIKFLNKNFDKVYSPTINYRNDNTFNKLYKDIKSLNPDLIVGSSMGGYVSYLIGSKLSIPVLLFNPAMVGRTFDPVVDDSNLKKTKTDIRFGKGDSVVSGIDVRKYFKDNKISFNHKGYDGGHRVPADVFINSIKDVLSMSEIDNKIKESQIKMKHIKLFEEFHYKPLVNETYELLEGSVSYEDLNDILNEGIFSFIKGIFMNPGQKRKLRKLGDQLFKIKVQIQKMDIEQNDISKAEDELKSKDSNYTADPALSVAVNAEEKKKQALENKEGIIIDQMDSVAGQNETLTKYVNKVKLEVRMKAHEATIKLADDEMERILRKIQKKDAKEVQTLDKVLAKAA